MQCCHLLGLSWESYKGEGSRLLQLLGTDIVFSLLPSTYLPARPSVTLITSLQICKINFWQIRYLACGKTFIAEEI